VAIINVSKKKYDRYTLPALLGLDLVAALGWVGALELVLQAVGLPRHWKTVRRAAAEAAVPLLALAQAALVLGPFFPAHYLACFNPWAGGLPKAIEMLPVGWGEGIEAMAAYLAAKPEAASLSVASWAVAGIAPFFPGPVTKLTAETVPTADYVVLYVADKQGQGPLTAKFEAQQPEFTLRMNGVEYAWLYRNDYYKPLAAAMAARAAPGDVIIANSPSAFQRHDPGSLPWKVIDSASASEEQVAAALQEATRSASHFFYLEYDNGQAVPRDYLRRQLAQSAILLWQQPFAFGTLSYYQLPAGHSFQRVQATVPAGVDLGGQLTLEAYGLAAERIDRRQQPGLALQFRALQPMSNDYHVFIHLLNGQGQIRGQGDAPLQDNENQRTTAWAPGSVHLCNYTVPLEANIPPGPYQLMVGVYSLQDMARLPAVDARGTHLDQDRILLGTITIE